MSERNRIRSRVLRGIALNRTPGLHFPANFLDISFDRVSRGGVRLSVDQGPWCADEAGETDLGALAILADLAIGASIRAHLTREARVATVSFSLQFTGAPRRGRLVARAEFQGFLAGGAGRLGLSRVRVDGSAGQVCFGTGGFMGLNPPKGLVLHPVPFRNRRSPSPSLPENLSKDEQKILDRADEALAAGGNFISHFWGEKGVLKNGLHAGNRVGHAQGGILIALAAKSAAARLGTRWRLGAVTALYISPGEGRTLKAKSEVLHQGGLTAVVRTMVTGKGGRRVLEVASSHLAIPQGQRV